MISGNNELYLILTVGESLSMLCVCAGGSNSGDSVLSGYKGLLTPCYSVNKSHLWTSVLCVITINPKILHL